MSTLLFETIESAMQRSINSERYHISKLTLHLHTKRAECWNR